MATRNSKAKRKLGKIKGSSSFPRPVNMSSHRGFVMLTVLILHFKTSWCDVSTKAEACTKWSYISRQIHHSNMLMKLNCHALKSCAGMTCTGEYITNVTALHIYRGSYFCLGLIVNNCDQPISMDIYFQEPMQNKSYVHRLTHNESLQIPGLSSYIIGGIKMDFFLIIQLKKIDAHHILFGVTGRGRLPFPGKSFWPEAKYPIIPLQKIPVSPCLGKAHSTPALHLNKHTRSCVKLPPLRTTTTISILLVSPTLGKRCNFGLSQCSHNEMCNEKKVCVCQPRHVLHAVTGYCESKDNPDNHSSWTMPKPAFFPGKEKAPSVLPSAHYHFVADEHTSEDGNPHSQRKNVAVIAGSAVGGIILLLVIVVAIAFVLHRIRRPCIRHELLINNEEVI